MLFSIITVNYNNKKGLKNTILSIVNQTNTNFEHIIIDGNSSDGSKDIINNYAEYFSYCVSEPDNGVYHAMNKGIKVSKGEYILFLNSGDTLYNNDVLELASKSMFDTLDFYYGDLIFCSHKKETLFKYPSELTFSFFYQKSLPHPATFIKRFLFETVFYYNEQFKIVSDWEFFVCAICKHNATYKHLNAIISKFNTDGLSNPSVNNKLILEERTISLNVHFPLFVEDTKHLIEVTNILKTNRFKILAALESSKVAKKINSVVLRVLLKLIKGKSIKDLK